MTWFAVYQTDDGRLVSGTDNPAQVASAEVLAARGYSVAECADGSQSGVWNTATHAFDAAAAAPIYITADQFLDLFTATEVVRCYASSDPNLQKLLRRLQIRFDPLDLLSATVSQGVGLVASLGLFDDQNGQLGAATQRPAVILGWRP